jgi:nucleoside-diphosphate-sugar epimerase
MDIVSLRYFTVYGPRQRPDMAFSRFLTAAIEDRRIEIYGDGTQTRDFTYVSDAVEANILAMDYRGGSSIFNIGGGSRSSILRVLDIIRALSGRELKVDFIDKAKGDVTDTWADTSAARGEMNFDPAVGLEEGIGREFDWYRNYSEAEAK